MSVHIPILQERCYTHFGKKLTFDLHITNTEANKDLGSYGATI